jgi:hypothetical protein
MSERPEQRIATAWRQWLTIALTLFVLVAAVVLAWQPYADEFLYEHVLAAGLENRYGFRGGRVSLHTAEGEISVYTLLDVTPGGPMDRAGFRVGDIPSGAFHSQSAAFLRTLSSGCDGPGAEILIGPIRPDGLPGEPRKVRLPCVR